MALTSFKFNHSKSPRNVTLARKSLNLIINIGKNSIKPKDTKVHSETCHFINYPRVENTISIHVCIMMPQKSFENLLQSFVSSLLHCKVTQKTSKLLQYPSGRYGLMSIVMHYVKCRNFT